MFIWWIPESPRWLMAKERHDKALDILAKYHANGDRNNAIVQFEYNEIKETIAMEYREKKNGSYLDFLRTRGNRYRLMLLISLGIISQYSGNAIFSNYSNIIYENAGIKDQAQKTGLNAGVNMLKLFVAIGCSCGIDRFGRRPLFLTATVGKLTRRTVLYLSRLTCIINLVQVWCSCSLLGPSSLHVLRLPARQTSSASVTPRSSSSGSLMFPTQSPGLGFWLPMLWRFYPTDSVLVV